MQPSGVVEDCNEKKDRLVDIIKESLITPSPAKLIIPVAPSSISAADEL